MTNAVLPREQIAQLIFSEAGSDALHSHSFGEIFYVLSGDVVFEADGARWHLGAEQFVLTNPGALHAHRAEKDALVACIHLNSNLIAQRLGAANLRFVCNSTLDGGYAYDKLRGVLIKLLNQGTRKTEKRDLMFDALCYELAHLLTKSFVEQSPDEAGSGNKTAQTAARVERYIRENCRQPVSLQEVAQEVGLTETYLSRFIKEKLGETFTAYLNRLRLERAVEDLGFTGKSITRISMDSGFPNLAAFNKAFKDAYRETPSVYAAALRSQAPLDPAPTQDRASEWAAALLSVREASPEGENSPEVREILADARHAAEYAQNWRGVINVGRCDALLNADIRAHLLQMRKDIGFRFVRFWDIYAVLFSEGARVSPDNINFARLDRVLDFLLDNDMIPYIELGFKPALLMRAGKNDVEYLVSKEQKILFDSDAAYSRFLTAFLHHYIDRYGLAQVESWFFEQWVDPRYVAGRNFERYLDVFAVLWRTLKEISPDLRVGGGGISYKNTNYEELLRQWRNRPERPDYISMYCYPYAALKGETRHFSFHHQVGGIRDAMNRNGFENTPLHVTEWNFTVTDRNPLHDSCFKGAYVAKTVIDNLADAALTGYWHASDVLSEYADSAQILNGSAGLVTVDGIQKPAYHAFSFLNELGNRLLLRDGNAIVTSDNPEHITAVCHNYKSPNYRYMLLGETEVPDAEQSRFFSDDGKNLHLKIRIDGVKNGTYKVRIRAVNAEHGSVQDEWIRLGKTEPLDRQELEYLKQICVPRIRVSACDATGNCLLLDTVLRPQEVQLIQFTYKHL